MNSYQANRQHRLLKSAVRTGAGIFALLALSQYFLIAPGLADALDAKQSKAAQEAEEAKETAKEAKEIIEWESKKGAANSAAATKTATWCKAHTVIKAPPEVVWRTVHEERQHDPDIGYTKVLEQGEHEYKLEQEFKFIPILGTSVCVTQHKEVPFERIDYTLVKSDHFKAMEGSWTFAPTDNGRATILELSSHLDLGLPVPKMFMNSISTKKLEKRLAHIKEMAENIKPVASAHNEHATH